MGEAVDLPCFYCGADMDDDLDHYLECEHMWSILINSANLGTQSLPLLALSPSERLGMLHPSLVCFKLLAGAFLVYHALKFDHMNELQHAFASGDHSPILILAARLAVHHYKEIESLAAHHEG